MKKIRLLLLLCILLCASCILIALTRHNSDITVSVTPSNVSKIKLYSPGFPEVLDITDPSRIQHICTELKKTKFSYDSLSNRISALKHEYSTGSTETLLELLDSKETTLAVISWDSAEKVFLLKDGTTYSCNTKKQEVYNFYSNLNQEFWDYKQKK
ncbi:MAG: hypothetical protein Q4F05_16380 [bacterium]|nr:hypothetical protein [bacterium]